MRIVQVSHGFPPTWGGVETHVADLAHRLARRGNEVLCVVGGEPTATDVGRPFRVHRVPMLAPRTLRARRDARARGDLDRFLLRSLSETLSEAITPFRASVIHFHNAHHFAPEPAWALHQIQGVSHINGVHDRIGDDVCENVLQLSWTHTLFASDHLRRSFGEVPGKSETLHLGVDLERFSPRGPLDRRLMALPRPVIFHPARALEWKGLHVGVEALRIILERFSTASLVLCGSEDLTDDLQVHRDYIGRLKQRARALGVESSVHFLSFTAEEVTNAYRASDIVWYPTIDEEPFGLVPLEAMATGVPVIVTASGGMTESVQDGISGMIVGKNDAGALGRAALTILTNATVRNSLRVGGRRRARAFSADTYVDRLEGLYEQDAAIDRQGQTP